MFFKSRRPQAACSALEGAAGWGTVTYRANPLDNQDAGGLVRTPVQRVLTVADGIGSREGSGMAARLAIESVSQRASSASQPWGMADIESVFAGTQERMASLSRDGETESLPGTTLLLLCESRLCVMAAYLGNGCLVRLPGNLLEYPESQALTWGCRDLLTPHSVPVEGKECLDHYFSPTSTPPMVQPGIVTVQKDRTCGDIFLIATDGLFSGDQVHPGRDAAGNWWVPQEKRLLLLVQALRELLKSTGPVTDATISQMLQGYFTAVTERRLLEDDLTVGILITEEALRYCARQQEEGTEL